MAEAIGRLEWRRQSRWLRRLRMPFTAIATLAAALALIALVRGRSLEPLVSVAPGTTGALLAFCGALGFGAAHLRGRQFWDRADQRRRLPEWLQTPGCAGRVTLTTTFAWTCFGLLMALPPAIGTIAVSATWAGSGMAALALLLTALLTFAGAATGDASFFLRLGMVPRWPWRAFLVMSFLALLGLSWRCNQVLTDATITWDERLVRVGACALLATPLPCLAALPNPAAWAARLDQNLDAVLPIEWAAAGYLLALTLGGLSAAWIAAVGWRRLATQFSEADSLGRGRDVPPWISADEGSVRGGSLWMQDLRLLASCRETTCQFSLAAGGMASAALLPVLLGGTGSLTEAQFLSAFQQGFHSLAVTLVFLATVLPTMFGVRALWVERECRRLDALLVTPFRASRLLIGKWFASGLMSLTALVPAAPLVAIMYVARGAEVASIQSLTILIATLVGINAFLGTLSAAICDRPATARLLALSMASILVAVPGGALSAALGLQAGARPLLAGSLSLPLVLFYLILLASLWRNALDRLRYAG